MQLGEVLEILDRGYGEEDKPIDEDHRYYEFEDRNEATDYIISKYDIDINNPKIQEKLGQYKEREEQITPAGERVVKGGFLGFGGSKKVKYPTKSKYGFTYEKKEDGKWHKVK